MILDRIFVDYFILLPTNWRLGLGYIQFSQLVEFFFIIYENHRKISNNRKNAP